MDKFPLQGEASRPPVRPLGEATPLAASPGGARRPPTTRLALTSVTSLGGGDLYRAGGARQGATPPSTPVHEVDSGQGSSGPETDIHIYVQSRPLSLPPPRAPSRARLPAPSEPHHPPSSTPATGAWGRPGCLWGPRTAAPGPVAPPLLPDSLLSAAPPICPSFVANWRMLGAYRDRRPEPPESLPLRQGRTPWSPLPIGTHAHDEIPLAHRASRRAVGVPCHAMPCWMDGSAAQVHAASPAARLPSDCHFAAPPRDSTPAHHAPAQSLPSCHAIPSTASTVEDHSHADSPTLTGLESCAQAFRGPNSILRGHTNAHKVGHHRPASQVLRSPPSLSTGENRSRATSGPRLDHPATGQVIRSPPMLPTGKG